jgi:hypothetical protein
MPDEEWQARTNVLTWSTRGRQFAEVLDGGGLSSFCSELGAALDTWNDKYFTDLKRYRTPAMQALFEAAFALEDSVCTMSEVITVPSAQGRLPKELMWHSTVVRCARFVAKQSSTEGSDAFTKCIEY